MSNLFGMPLLLAGTAFFVGWIVAKLAAASARFVAPRRQVAEEHEWRAMEAELRVARRDAEKAREHMAQADQIATELREEVAALRELLGMREARLAEIEGNLTEECGKTAELRVALTERVTESARAAARVREMETALEVAETGSSIVHEEVSRLAAETAELTDRLQRLQVDIPGDGEPQAEKA